MAHLKFVDHEGHEGTRRKEKQREFVRWRLDRPQIITNLWYRPI